MKIKILGLLFIGLLVSGFKNAKADVKTLASVEGLNLYMDHQVFGESGRVLRFEFYETKQFETRFKLVFEYDIEGTEIIVSLVDKFDVEKDQKIKVYDAFERLKTPIGRLSFPDELLPENTYTLILNTLDFEVRSELIIGTDKITLNIPENNHFTCPKNIVYPIPRDLLFGSVCFYGDRDNKCVAKFFEELEALGFEKTEVPNYPYMHLSVGDDGRPVDKHWPNNQHCLSFLYKMDNNFRKAAKLAKEWYQKKYHISFSLYSSNGDQAILNETNGVVTSYAD